MNGYREENEALLRFLILILITDLFGGIVFGLVKLMRSEEGPSQKSTVRHCVESIKNQQPKEKA